MLVRKLICLSHLALLGWTGTTPAQQPAQRQVQLPTGVEVHRDVEYVLGGHRRQKLDLYLPAKAQRPVPVIIWIHGGAWLGGNKDGGSPALPFVSRGYAVASINYRLSHHDPFPAQIEDCKAAVRWLRANARKYRLDPDHFGAWGASAGGHLAALLGTGGNAKELEGAGGNLDQSSRVQAVVDLFGPADIVAIGAYRKGPDSPEAKLIGGPIPKNKEKALRASPTYYASKESPPFLILHGDKDPQVLFRQSELLTEALTKAGADVTLVRIEGAGHGGPAFNTPERRKQIEEFLDKHLKAGRKPPSRQPTEGRLPPRGADAPAQLDAGERQQLQQANELNRQLLRLYGQELLAQVEGLLEKLQGLAIVCQRLVRGKCYLKSRRPRAAYAELIEHLNAQKPKDGWFSQHYGGISNGKPTGNGAMKKPWQIHNTRKLDAIREEIDNLRLPDVEKAVALTSLILALDRVDSTLGHFVSYLKDWSPRSYNDLRLEVPQLFASTGDHQVTREDIFSQAQSAVDLAYYDPPYGSNNEKMPPSRVRYASYYHVWTTIILNDRPELFGKALRRRDTSDTVASSIFEEFRRDPATSRFIAVETIARLIRSTRARWVILSYSSGGRATAKELNEVLQEHGTLVEVVELDYKRNVMGNMKWTNEWIRGAEGPNREFLFLLERKMGAFG